MKTIWLWEEDYPSTLKPDELENPFLVFEDFFGKYSLDKARQLVWEWFQFYYKEDTWSIDKGPVTLFLFYKATKRLLDATWQLNELSSVDDNIKRTLSTPLKDLPEFKETQFSELDNCESLSPSQIINLFFADISLQWCQNGIDNWLSIGFTDNHLSSGCLCTQGKEFAELIEFMKLIEICFLLFQIKKERIIPIVSFATQYTSIEEINNCFLSIHDLL